jgi:hypothetical protein
MFFFCQKTQDVCRGEVLPPPHRTPHSLFERMVFVQIDNFPRWTTDIAIASVVGWQAVAAGGWGGAE